MVHDGRPRTSDEPRTGELLGAQLGNYRIVELIGQGGMGEVYVGRHERLGHRVAVKVLRLEMSRNADMVRRFFNEAQAATAIRSPGIVQIFDFGTLPDGRAYFVMELLEGQSLDARLKQRRLDYVACCRLGRQVANVLHAAHTAGITHRDLKPENLFLIQDVEVAGGERVKVLDFGIAKLAGEVHAAGVKTRTDVVMGTPSYMSPEQSRGAGAVDARSDVYSLGCILFEMVCGRPPFVGEGIGGIIGAHQYVDPPNPRSLAPDVPARLAKLILQMLAKAPEARPQTMAAVGQALEEILQALDKAPKRAPTAAPAAKRAPTAAPAASAASAPPAFRDTEAVTIVAGTAGQRRRMWIVLGGLVAAGIVIGIVAATLTSDSPGPAGTSAAGADRGAGSASGAALDQAAAEVAATPPPPAPVVPAPSPPPPVAAAGSAAGQSELELECLRHQADQQWSELAACADRLAAASPALAKELEARASLETKAVPRINAFEAAMREKNLKKARAELDGLANVTSYAKLKQAYDTAETAAIGDLVARLERAKGGDCREYNLLVEQEKASKPPRVAAEATRQVKCTPAGPPPSAKKAPAGDDLLRPKTPRCDAAELAEKGKGQHALGQYVAALTSFELAWTCKQDPTYAEKAFVVACNVRNPSKAKLFWKRMTAPMRQRAVMICVRNGVTEDALNAP